MLSHGLGAEFASIISGLAPVTLSITRIVTTST
jgi:hypothetical protein